MEDSLFFSERPPKNGVTLRQAAVLRLIEQRLTIKEIAAELDVSESAINQRIRAIKERLGVNTQRELADFARTYLADEVEKTTCSETACRKNQVHSTTNFREECDQDERGSVFTLHDSLDFNIESPWARSEPQIVPRVLDGESAGWSRGAAIMVIAVAIFATIIVALGAAQGITEAINSRTVVPPEHSTRSAQ